MNPESNSENIKANQARIELEQLAFRQLADGLLSEEEFQAVEEQLLADKAFRERYLEFIRLEAVLVDALSQSRGEAAKHLFPSVARIPRRSRFGLYVCGILACTGIAVMLILFSPPRNLQKQPEGPVADTKAVPEVPLPSTDLIALTLQQLPDAAIVTQADRLALETADPPVQIGKRLKPGGLSLPKGRVQLDFLNGAQLVLEAPAQLLILSPDAATLLAGNAAARVPESAKGFVLNGPNSAVVDLGTEFTMSVNDQNVSEVHVVEGEVEVSLLGDDGNTLQSDRLSQASTVRLSRTMARMDEIAAPTHLLPPVGRPVVPALNVTEEYVQQVLNDGARIYWRFEQEDQGIIRNEAGADYSGRIVPALGPEYGIELKEGRLNLTEAGSPRFVEADKPLDRLNFQSYSIEMWVNPAGFHHAGLVAIFPADDPFALRHLIVLEIAHKTSMVHVPGAFRFLHRSPPRERGGLNLFSQTSCIPGQWHHFVATKTRKELKLYINGEVVRQLDIRRVSDSQPYQLLIGQLRNSNLERQFLGAMDEFAVYWRALSSDEIRRHFELLSGSDEEIELELPR